MQKMLRNMGELEHAFKSGQLGKSRKRMVSLVFMASHLIYKYPTLVLVDVPDVRGRTEILKVHASNKKFDKDVSLEVITMRTPEFSGVDLANLLNEAVILAGRRAKTGISSKEIDDSIDRIVAGMEGTVMTDGKSQSLVAYHVDAKVKTRSKLENVVEILPAWVTCCLSMIEEMVDFREHESMPKGCFFFPYSHLLLGSPQ